MAPTSPASRWCYASHDRQLGARGSPSGSGSPTCASTVELAAPWFIGAAMGLQVFGAFSVASAVHGGVRVEAGSTLDGIRMIDRQPRPASSRSFAPGRLGDRIRAATPSSTRRYRRTWSGRIESCWPRCAAAAHSPNMRRATRSGVREHGPLANGKRTHAPSVATSPLGRVAL